MENTPAPTLDPLEPRSADEGKPRFRDMLREIGETILLAVVIFAALRFFVQNFRIEGNSMEPNLHDGQFLIVDKISYKLGNIQRGDVIVFRAPPNPSKDFIKRVIGLPGDTIQILDGTVLVNRQPLAEPYIPFRDGRSWGPGTVGESEFFVLGDNRPSSNDSRQWGMLARSEVVGRAWLCYWPPQDWGLIKHPRYAR